MICKRKRRSKSAIHLNSRTGRWLEEKNKDRFRLGDENYSMPEANLGSEV